MTIPPQTAADLDSVVPYIDERWRKLLPMIDPSAWADEQAPEREWALTGWIPLRQATYLTGPGSSGKSLLSQQLSTCIALGLPFMGAETRRAPAMYISCEDDADELHRRQKAICDALGISVAVLADKLHLVSLAGALGSELATFEAPARDEYGVTTDRIRPTKVYHAIEGMAVAHGVGFISLDNVAHLYAGNENIRNEVASFMSLMNRLAIRTAGSVLLLGHPNKAGDSFSGSTAWENQVRSRIFLESPKGDDGRPFDPDARVLRLDKANYARNGAQLAFRWYSGAFVDERDIPIDQREEIAANAQASHDNEIFLSCLKERNRQERAVSENNASRTYAPNEFAKMPESKGIGKTRLEAALDRLFRIGRIERAFLWRSDGKDRFGLKEKAADLAADLPLTGVADLRPPLTPTPALSHPIPKGIGGQAFGPPAPHADDIQWDVGP